MTERTETPPPPQKLTMEQSSDLHAASLLRLGNRNYNAAIDAAAARLRYLETQHEALIAMVRRLQDGAIRASGRRSAGAGPHEEACYEEHPTLQSVCEVCRAVKESIDLLASLSPLPAQAAKDGE